MTARSKTKVLFLIPSLKYRGAEKMLVNLVNQFNHDRFSIHVVSLSRENPMAAQIRHGAATFTALPRARRYDMGPARELRQIILNQQIDVIIAFDIFSFFYTWMALLGIRSRPKIFISIHNTKFKSYRHWFQNFIYARLLSKNEVFLSVCDAQIDYWVRTYRIPRSSFITIHNGVDTELFSPCGNLKPGRLTRQELGIPEEAFVILQVASLAPEKRHEDAFLALKSLVDEIEVPVRLVCVGDGTEERKRFLNQLTQDAGVHEHVIFCGVQNDVKPFYEIADLFTLTSSTETFSMAALEAMSMGVPCVLTDVGGACEMIVDGMNGYLVRAGDAHEIAKGWLAGYKNRHGFDRPGIRNRAIKNFSLSECARKYENLFAGFCPDAILLGEKHVETQSL